MKIDPLLQIMSEDTVRLLFEYCFRDHVACECVDHRDADQHTKHLAEIATEVLEPMAEGVTNYVLKGINADQAAPEAGTV
jgi:hypothetical protein